MPHCSAWARVASEVGTPITFKPGAHLFAEQVDEMLRGRTGAEAELHAVAHLLQRARRRLPFQFFHIHAMAMPPRQPLSGGHI